MPTSLAAQLSQIAATSTKSLDLKAQKAAHSKSLIFEPRIAASQSFDSLYTLCHEGFQELCLLDGRFMDFQRSIFGEQSLQQDRTQMTAAENAELDKRLEAFLGLVGARLRLNPAIKAVEWLVRRFRIHEYNTAFLLTTFLPYHTLPAFTTLLSILPANLPSQYRFLHPYVRSLTHPPRHAIVFAATNDPTLTTLLNSYAVRICNARQNYPALISFWAGVMTEAVSGMLDKSRSGREAVQAQNQEEIILRLGPTLNEGLAMKKVPEFRIGCYMLLSIMASKGGLNDKLLTAMMEAVVLGWTADTFVPGLVCLSILAQQRGAKQMTKRVTRELLKVEGLPELLLEISKTRRIDKLANGIVLALVDRLGKSGDATVLPLIGHIVQNELLSEAQGTVVVKSLLLVAYRIDEDIDPKGHVRQDLARTLTTLAEYPGQPGVIARKAMEDASVDIDELELKLQASIRPKLIQSATDGDVDMEDADEASEEPSEDFHALLKQLPDDDSSFLSRSDPPPLHKFTDLFLAALATKENLDEFDLALKTERNHAVRYFSFYITVWSGPYPVLARTAALERATQSLNDATNESLDFQGIIPYVIIALGDQALKVRRAASSMALALAQRYPADAELKKAKGLNIWAEKTIYGRGKNAASVSWMTVENAARLLRDIICPGLEECVIDKKHIVSIIEKSLNGPKESVDSPKKQTAKHSQALRLAVLTNLASHVVYTPLYAAKYRLLVALNEVRGVTTTTRTKLLLPVLQNLAALSFQAAKENCEAEHIDVTAYNDEAVAVVLPNDEEGFQVLASIAQGEIAPGGEALCAALFRRIRNMWPSLKGDSRLNTAQLLMNLSQPPSDDARHSEFAQAEAMELLRSVNLTTDILLSFLNQLPTAAQLADMPPATKRRRVSHGEIAKTPVQDMKSLTGAVHKVSFVLQMVDNSSPEKHVALLPGLFNALAELQHFKSQVGSELGYLQGLVLSSLLSIMKAHKADPRLKLDRSAVRADLLVDCVQKTASPQVQNAALLLIADLASTAPELVLHSVMPIFTFMGSSVLRQNDEYSAHVIKQTIAEVIPPLIASLRKEKGGPVTGAAELLLSFVAAYEHVPAHRRKGLYTSLVQTLGPEDFLFAVLGMLADKYGATESIKAFSVDLASSFSVDVQLQTAVKYLDLAADLLKPRPTISAVLLGSSESSTTDGSRSALTQLTLLPHLLSEKKLINQTARLLQRDDMDASRVRELYSTLLENLLSLADQVKADKKLHNACGNVLERVLGLLSTSEFVKSVESLLDRPNEELRRKILRSLEVRVDQEKQSNVAARQAMLAFLPQLTAIIRESGDILYKHIAVTCVDKIAEKYGKKDLEAVAIAAETIAGERCLGQDDERLQVMSLLCLASLVDILREGIVSVLPIAIPAALQYMAKTVEEGGQNDKLHNAGYAFINALVEHLPYMISGSYLDTLLVISNKSAEADLEVEADESRIACLDLAAKQIEAKNMFTALQKNWPIAAECGTIALREFLDILSTAIDKHTKATVTKHSPILSTIFLSAFDLRRQWTVSNAAISEDEISEIENLVNSVAIKMIYKFNDSTFRPIFANLLEWASTGLPKKDTAGRLLRLRSIYTFTTLFFTHLKSIVTSYTTYLLPSALSALESVDPANPASRALWSNALHTLAAAAAHDQDDFFQAPAHFDVLAPALTSQLAHAATLPLSEDLVPALVELAAVADSADHHKALNAAIMKSLRDTAPAVRLAAVKAEEALTERLGEEWLALLPEMLPFISELQEDEDEEVERETHRWIVKIEGVLGESLDAMLQ
ncbi:hypothetical protein V500_05078 [Pseudogymnoascus sp. VKM F-4518 (FW-2643)]|nr:hypothetical protein V500_05078 [Pseudogymnoascus sp. VKM F-4518 (FW-2643)]